MRPGVFLDRDDTILERFGPPPPVPAGLGDVIDPERVRLVPGAGEALARLAEAGFALVVVSNQGVVARGGGTPAMVEAVNDRLRRLLLDESGVRLDAVYYCPYHPKPHGDKVPPCVPEWTREYVREHPWRKPQPGMILAAASDLQLDLARSWLVGDQARDIEAGMAAGLPRARCLLIGEGGDVPDITSAADVILAAHDVVRIVGSGGEVTSVMMHGARHISHPRVRATVLATVRAIGERAGVRVLFADFRNDTLIVTLEGDRLAGLGLLAEVRRATDRWHMARTGERLWQSGSES
jgi:D-glycero-D-manno-heptose 1,7-bisphosphate phosphatase